MGAEGRRLAVSLFQAPEESAPVALSRFERTVAWLQRAPAEQQTDFSLAALAELAAVYMAEADLARAGSASPEGSPRPGLLGWSVAVDEYANQLLLVLDEVEQGQAVSLRLSHLGPAIVAVADRVVILGHPRADQQGAFEQQVLADFCSRHDCGPVTTAAATSARPEPIPVTVVRVNPVWAFTASGQTRTMAGLVVSNSKPFRVTLAWSDAPGPTTGGVALVPGSAFGLGGHIRLSIATSMANLEKALERIEAVVQ